MKEGYEVRRRWHDNDEYEKTMKGEKQWGGEALKGKLTDTRGACGWPRVFGSKKYTDHSTREGAEATDIRSRKGRKKVYRNIEVCAQQRRIRCCEHTPCQGGVLFVQLTNYI